MFLRFLIKLKDLNVFLIALACFSIGGLCFAYFSEIVLGIKPCLLCIYQRYILAFMGGFSLLSLKIPFFKHISLSLLAAAFLLNSYQIGVEQKWFKQPDFCTQKTIPASDLEGLSPEEKQKRIQSIQVVPCDVIAWRFLGIPMTIWIELALFMLIDWWFFWIVLLKNIKLKGEE